VLVFHDLAGLTPDPAPRFVRRYAAAGDVLRAAVCSYARDVRDRTFPTPEHTYPIAPDELAAFEQTVN
jgi:3-methyl-2-oxobutanoate hydroxymethyltransferase